MIKNNKIFTTAIILFLFVLIVATAYIGKKITTDRKNKNREIISSTPSLTYLKNTKANIGDSDLIKYYNLANNETMESCENKTDEDICKFSIAVVKNNHSLCGDIPNKSLQTECANTLTKNNAEIELDKCLAETDSNIKANCLVAIFTNYSNEDECGFFDDETYLQLCKDTVNLRSSIIKNINLCDKIKNAAMNFQCNEIFKPGDYDNDQLNDTEEAKIGTNPLLSDTDKDGFSDGDEISKNYNPCGDGPLPLSELLIQACASYKK